METMTKSANLLETLTAKRLKFASNVLRAINHPLRMQFVHLIDQNGKLTVTQIYFKMRIEQSVASQHLAILREAEVLTATRKGKNIFYSVNNAKLEAIAETLELLEV
jgi:DNA-binding transcriptional ArsR family regulator